MFCAYTNITSLYLYLKNKIVKALNKINLDTTCVFWTGKRNPSPEHSADFYGTFTTFILHIPYQLIEYFF